MFNQPTAPNEGDQFEPKSFNGKLLMVFPAAHHPVAATKFGDAPATDADVIVVDTTDPATGQPYIFKNARLFGNLALSTKQALGSVVLARLGQGPNTKGNPPWILTPHSDSDAQLAQPLYDNYKSGAFRQAVASSSPPTAAAVNDPWSFPAAAAPAPAANLDQFLRGLGIDPTHLDSATKLMVAQSKGWTDTVAPPF